MSLQKQVCTLKQAKRLSKLGVNRPSLCYYCEDTTYKKGKGFVTEKDVLKAYFDGVEFIDTEHYSAFTAHELFKMLPYSVKDAKGVEYIQSVTKDFDHYTQTESFTAGYYNFQLHRWHYGHGREDTAEAAADLLITVIEQKDITVEEINALTIA